MTDILLGSLIILGVLILNELVQISKILKEWKERKK